MYPLLCLKIPSKFLVLHCNGSYLPARCPPSYTLQALCLLLSDLEYYDLHCDCESDLIYSHFQYKAVYPKLMMFTKVVLLAENILLAKDKLQKLFNKTLRELAWALYFTLFVVYDVCSCLTLNIKTLTVIVTLHNLVGKLL